MALLTIERLSPSVGAEVSGVDAEALAHDGCTAEAVLEALEDNGVLVFRGLHLEPEKQVAFGQRLGEVDYEDGYHPVKGISRVTRDATKRPTASFIPGTFLWHIDGCTPLHDENPQKATILTALTTCEVGGETEFASSYIAYDELAEEEKDRFACMQVLHSFESSMRTAYPDATPAQLEFILGQEEFFDIDKSQFPLIPAHCEVWEGFIFVNLAPEPTQALKDFLGPMVLGLEGYPFHLMTERYGFRAEILSNWKIFLDAFQEYYHAPVLHSQQQVPSLRSYEYVFECPHYQIDGPHRLVSTGGYRGTPRHQTPPELMYPIEHLTEAGLMGPWKKPALPELEINNLPPGVNPGEIEPWSMSNFQIFPNFVILVYERGWYLTYHYWPLTPGTHLWEMSYYFPPARNTTERIQHEVTAVVSKEAALQDAGTLDGTQMGLESRLTDRYPLGDQEITVRHFHKVVGDWVDDYRHEQSEAADG